MEQLNLYYVTNRKHQGEDQFKPDLYGPEPSSSGIENLRFGRVSVPADRAKITSLQKKNVKGLGAGNGNDLSEYLIGQAKKGRIEAYPESIPNTNIAETDQDNVKLGSQAMFADIRDVMVKGCDVVIFIHGYNVDWFEAVGSALALQEMLNRPIGNKKVDKPVMVVLFSWPSDGSMLPFVAYKSDRTDALASGFALGRAMLKLRDHLASLTKRYDDGGKRAIELCKSNLHVLCHSMGNYVLQNAVQRMIERGGSNHLPRMFNHVFMCAADVDDNVLEPDQPMGRVHEICRTVNVYYNRGDAGLHISDYTKGNPDRLGTNGVARPAQLHNKIHQIDCSDVVRGAVEHSYYLDGRANRDIRQSLDDLEQNASQRSRKPGALANTWILK